jgi:hypothetical protein
MKIGVGSRAARVEGVVEFRSDGTREGINVLENDGSPIDVP